MSLLLPTALHNMLPWIFVGAIRFSSCPYFIIGPYIASSGTPHFSFSSVLMFTHFPLLDLRISEEKKKLIKEQSYAINATRRRCHRTRIDRLRMTKNYWQRKWWLSTMASRTLNWYICYICCFHFSIFIVSVICSVCLERIQKEMSSCPAWESWDTKGHWNVTKTKQHQKLL